MKPDTQTTTENKVLFLDIPTLEEVKKMSGTVEEIIGKVLSFSIELSLKDHPKKPQMPHHGSSVVPASPVVRKYLDEVVEYEKECMKFNSLQEARNTHNQKVKAVLEEFIAFFTRSGIIEKEKT